MPSIFSNQPISKSNVFEGNWNKLSKKKKEFYYLDTDCDVLVDFNSLYINNKCFNSLIAFLTTCISCWICMHHMKK